MQRSSQAGFGLLAMLAVVLIVGVLGLSSWYVFQQNRPETSNATEQDGNQTPNNNQPVNGEADPTVAYLEVKEWGVRLALSENIKDAYYIDAVAHTDSPDGLPGAVFLSLRFLTEDKCDPNNNNQGGRGAIGAILRFLPNEKDFVTGELLIEEYPNGTQIGEYYYGFQSGKKDNPCATEDELGEIDTSFALSAKNITKSSATNE